MGPLMTIPPPMAILVEKALILGVGVALAWMGYRLFSHGFSQGTGASAEEDLWKQFLPGFAFSVFAGVVIVVGLNLPSGGSQVADQIRQSIPVEPDWPIDLEGVPLRPMESRDGMPEAGSGLAAHF